MICDRIGRDSRISLVLCDSSSSRQEPLTAALVIQKNGTLFRKTQAKVRSSKLWGPKSSPFLYFGPQEFFGSPAMHPCSRYLSTVIARFMDNFASPIEVGVLLFCALMTAKSIEKALGSFSGSGYVKDSQLFRVMPSWKLLMFNMALKTGEASVNISSL